MDPNVKTTNAEEAEEPIDVENIKMEINQLIWQRGRGTLTLNEAEEIACEMFDCFMKAT